MANPSIYEPQAAGVGSDDATPRNTLALRDVAYVIEAEPYVYDVTAAANPQKFAAMLERRVARGQHYHMPCLGCREFACSVSPPDSAERPIAESRELGLMLYDIIFRDNGRANKAAFFQARLANGVMNTDPNTALSDHSLREEVLECSSRR
jgi:CRISPR-associated protein Cas5d